MEREGRKMPGLFFLVAVFRLSLGTEIVADPIGCSEARASGPVVGVISGHDGTEAIMECAAGFVLKDARGNVAPKDPPPKAHCTKGNWNLTHHTCEYQVPPPSRCVPGEAGNPSTPHVEEGVGGARLKCGPGFNLVLGGVPQPELPLTCVDGTWRSNGRDISGVYACKADCPIPIPGSSIVLKEGPDKFGHYKITCPEGQVLMSKNGRVQTALPVFCTNGQWNVHNYVCEEDCPRTTTGATIFVNQKGDAACPLGQILVHDGEVRTSMPTSPTCQNGQWIFNGYSCRPRGCMETVPGVTLATSWEPVSKFSCASGHELVDQKGQKVIGTEQVPDAACGTDGVWNLNGYSCRKACPRTSTGESIFVLPTGVMVCPEGQEMLLDGEVVKFANEIPVCEDGQWIFHGYSCRVKDCPKASTGTTIFVNENREMECPTGQELVHDGTVEGKATTSPTCSDGQWIFHGYSCRQKGCEPRTITTSVKAGEDGVPSHLSCPPGEELVKDAIVTVSNVGADCRNGRFNFTGYSCRQKRCPTKMPSIFNPESEVACPTGQELVRDGTVVGTADDTPHCINGQWIFRGYSCRPKVGPQDGNCWTCTDIYKANYKAADGEYNITLWDTNTRSHLRVPAFCHFTEERAYTVFHRQTTTSMSFAKPWVDYKRGFGYHRRGFRDNWWWGNDNLHLLTHSCRENVLRVELMESCDKIQRHAEYNYFSVASEYEQYRAHLVGYRAHRSNLVDGLINPATPSGSIDGMGFTTLDRENDKSPKSQCSLYYGKGGWWFNSCYQSHLTGYLSPSPCTTHGGGASNWFNTGHRRYMRVYNSTMMLAAN